MRRSILPKGYAPSVIEPEIVDDNVTSHNQPTNIYIQNNFNQYNTEEHHVQWPDDEDVVCDWSMTRKMSYAYRVNPILSTVLLFGPSVVFLLFLYFLVG